MSTVKDNLLTEIEKLRAKLQRLTIALEVIESLEPKEVKEKKPRTGPKFDRPALKNRIFLLLGDEGKKLGTGAIVSSLSMNNKAQRRAVWNCLFEMKRDGVLDRDADRLYFVKVESQKETVQ